MTIELSLGRVRELIVAFLALDACALACVHLLEEVRPAPGVAVENDPGPVGAPAAAGIHDRRSGRSNSITG
jgi:hypothetical protein